MPFGLVNWVGRGMGVLDGSISTKEKEGIGFFLTFGLNGVFERIFEFDSCEKLTIFPYRQYIVGNVCSMAI